MKENNIKYFEYIIGISILGFWLFLVIFGVKNQFNIASIKSTEFFSFLEKEKPLIVDLRESSEVQRFPLDYQETIHLPFLFIESRLEQINIPQNKPVLLVCSDGNRARLIATLLSEKGIKSYYLKSGLEGVKESRVIEE